MKLADQIRKYVIDQIIIPARIGGKEFITIRSGDVHKAMKLNNRMPAVCGAIGSNIFLQESGTKLISRKGPNQGANVEWVFKVN